MHAAQLRTGPGFRKSSMLVRAMEGRAVGAFLEKCRDNITIQSPAWGVLLACFSLLLCAVLCCFLMRVKDPGNKAIED